MRKEYKIVFIKSVGFQVLTVLIFLDLYLLYLVMKEKTIFPAFLTFVAITIMTGCFSYFYMEKLRVLLYDDRIVIKMPDRTTQIMIKDIYRIDKELGWGSYGFYINYIENGKRRIAGFSDEIQGYQEILSYIERKRPKNHPASEESRIKKILRTIFLVIMYSFMFGIPLFMLFTKK